LSNALTPQSPHTTSTLIVHSKSFDSSTKLGDPHPKLQRRNDKNLNSTLNKLQ
jgi:hypothetical protein